MVIIQINEWRSGSCDCWDWSQEEKTRGGDSTVGEGTPQKLKETAQGGTTHEKGQIKNQHQLEGGQGDDQRGHQGDEGCQTCHKLELEATIPPGPPTLSSWGNSLLRQGGVPIRKSVYWRRGGDLQSASFWGEVWGWFYFLSLNLRLLIMKFSKVARGGNEG